MHLNPGHGVERNPEHPHLRGKRKTPCPSARNQIPCPILGTRLHRNTPFFFNALPHPRIEPRMEALSQWGKTRHSPWGQNPPPDGANTPQTQSNAARNNPPWDRPTPDPTPFFCSVGRTGRHIATLRVSGDSAGRTPNPRDPVHQGRHRVPPASGSRRASCPKGSCRAESKIPALQHPQ